MARSLDRAACCGMLGNADGTARVHHARSRRRAPALKDMPPLIACRSTRSIWACPTAMRCRKVARMSELRNQALAALCPFLDLLVHRETANQYKAVQPKESGSH